MTVQDLKIGQYGYHRDVYRHNEPLRIIGIKETELELEGDFSGGTHNVVQRQWMPLKGFSFIRNHAYKQECRNTAIAIEKLSKPITGTDQDATANTMLSLLQMVLYLTNEVALNHEF